MEMMQSPATRYKGPATARPSQVSVSLAFPVPTDVASPGGEPPSMNHVEDAYGRSIDRVTSSEYSWESPKALESVPPIVVCHTHGPTEDCDCNVVVASLPTQVHESYVPSPHTPTEGARRSPRSYGSHSTITEIFPRPHFVPGVPSTQLPEMCNKADSDDALFGATPSECEDDHDYDQAAADATATPDLDMLADTIVAWIARTEKPAPSLPEAEFTFAAPSSAPPFPSQVHVPAREWAPRSESPDTLRAARVLSSMNGKRPRPSDAELHESDTILVRSLSGPKAGHLHDENKPQKLHGILVASSSGDPTSYAKAPTYIQRHVRRLIAQYPHFRVDVLTPIDFSDRFIQCMLPSCTAYIAADADRAVWEAHIKAEHWPRDTAGPIKRGLLKCPLCPAKKKPILASSMGRHMHAQHSAELPPCVAVQCKICDSMCADINEFADTHFPACQDCVRLEGPALKRQRTE
ncbi:hypothetical protein DFH07DRAFT_1067873 [Mycena maculata]|uniref:Uncharacterized protein n=1 Tax=Mycena maculata TaxID=230809 RepID=A0AAD7HGQ7_9AGAR|nr:hypothetical protein DFH07DRAFT_1067873 [Mycena maculata]